MTNTIIDGAQVSAGFLYSFHYHMLLFLIYISKLFSLYGDVTHYTLTCLNVAVWIRNGGEKTVWARAGRFS